jgi:hypothetical protein
MSRKPVHLEMVGGKGNRQRVWEAVRKIAHSPEILFSVEQVAHATKLEVPMVRDYINCLWAGTFLLREEPIARGKPAYYQLVRDNGVEAPRVRRNGQPVTQGLRQEQMWRTLRLLRGRDTSARELAAHASTPELTVAESAAADYLKNLLGAKYLQRTQEPGGKGQPARYRLVSDTGPKPPMVCRVDGMFDPNLGELIWVQPVNEEDCIYAQ